MKRDDGRQGRWWWLDRRNIILWRCHGMQQLLARESATLRWSSSGGIKCTCGTNLDLDRWHIASGSCCDNLKIFVVPSKSCFAFGCLPSLSKKGLHRDASAGGVVLNVEMRPTFVCHHLNSLFIAATILEHIYPADLSAGHF
jgi:hypothetical protein